MSANVLLSNVILTSTVAAALLVTITTYFYFKKKRVLIPHCWTPVGKVIKVCIYPLKSGRRLEVETAECTTYGLVTTNENEFQLKDRSFVVYGENSFEFKTARTYPKLLLIDTSVHDSEHVLFDAPNQRSLYVKISNLEEMNKVQISLHGNERVYGCDCGDEAASWFSHFILEKPSGLRLLYHDGKFRRNITGLRKSELKACPKLRSEDMGMYSDLSSYLLINQSSIDSLNKNLEEAVTANNFRPNFLVEGNDILPFSEEAWDWIKIGSVIFRNVKPCTRCILTTINPETGNRSASREPLKSLERFNTWKDPTQVELFGKSPVMGINLGLKSFGRIALGDEVYIPKAEN